MSDVVCRGGQNDGRGTIHEGRGRADIGGSGYQEAGYQGIRISGEKRRTIHEGRKSLGISRFTVLQLVIIRGETIEGYTIRGIISGMHL